MIHDEIVFKFSNLKLSYRTKQTKTHLFPRQCLKLKEKLISTLSIQNIVLVRRKPKGMLFSIMIKIFTFTLINIVIFFLTSFLRQNFPEIDNRCKGVVTRASAISVVCLLMDPGCRLPRIVVGLVYQHLHDLAVQADPYVGMVEYGGLGSITSFGIFTCYIWHLT